jgi:hypothetical protein
VYLKPAIVDTGLKITVEFQQDLASAVEQTFEPCRLPILQMQDVKERHNSAELPSYILAGAPQGP